MEAEQYTREELYNLIGGECISWSNGGTYRNCWGDTGTVDAEEPSYMHDWIRQVAEAFPEVTACTIFKMATYVSTSSNSYSDYYGGCTSESQMSISTNDIIDVLIEDGYVELV